MSSTNLQRSTLFDPQTRMRMATGEKPSILLKDLQHFYGEGELRKQILFNNSLTVYPGEIIIMTGPSGSGKTTLLTLIGALRSVQQGQAEVLGRSLHGATAKQLQRFRQDIGFIFQAHNLFDSLTATQNVRMSLELEIGKYSKAELNQKAHEMLVSVGLGERLHHKPKQLSGGQKQRVAIARGLVHRPKLVLADEPTAALDEHSGRMVVELLKKLATEEKTTIVIVTHDNRILDVADRIVTLVDGHIRTDTLIQEAAILTQMLAKIKLFEKVTPRTLTLIADQMNTEFITAGTRIIQESDPGDRFFLVRQGSVVVRRGQPETDIATLRAGDCFGEAALITGQPRNASVYAIEDSFLCSLSKDRFQAAMSESASHADEIRNAYAGAYDR